MRTKNFSVSWRLSQDLARVEDKRISLLIARVLEQTHYGFWVLTIVIELSSDSVSKRVRKLLVCKEL